MAKAYNIPFTVIGIVGGRYLTIDDILNVSVDELKAAYNKGL
jgi:hypothetical protein